MVPLMIYASRFFSITRKNTECRIERSEYKIEMRDGALTLLNPSDGKPVMRDGRTLSRFKHPDAIKNLLLESKDEAKSKLYRAIVIANRASGSGGAPSQRIKAAPAPRVQFGLGMSVK